MTKTLQPRYRAVLFDLDGTIADTLADLTASLNVVLSQYGQPARTKEEVCSFIGNGILLLVERAFPSGTDGAVMKAAQKDFLTYYGAHFAEETKPYPDVLALLKELSTAGVKLALVSNKSHEMVCGIANRFFSGIFSYALGCSEKTPRKPDPTGVFLAMQALGVSKEEACYVGDSEVDVQTAQNAGMDCVSVTWGYRTKEQLLDAGAKRLAHSACELQKELFYNKENDHA